MQLTGKYRSIRHGLRTMEERATIRLLMQDESTTYTISNFGEPFHYVVMENDSMLPPDNVIEVNFLSPLYRPVMKQYILQAYGPPSII